jgi:DNA-binding MarR family transcriptional regulator
MNFQDTGYTIKVVQQQIHTAMEDALRPLSLTLPQYNVLKGVKISAHTTGAELARKAFVTPQTMHTMLTTMERKELITRKAIAGNGKSFSVSITSKGTKVLKDAESALAGIFNAAGVALTPDEHAKLEQLLRKLSLGLKT